jgi:hypothetical protein
MHAIEIRAAIFAIRAELDWWHNERYLARKGTEINQISVNIELMRV